MHASVFYESTGAGVGGGGVSVCSWPHCSKLKCDAGNGSQEPSNVGSQLNHKGIWAQKFASDILRVTFLPFYGRPDGAQKIAGTPEGRAQKGTKGRRGRVGGAFVAGVTCSGRPRKPLAYMCTNIYIMYIYTYVETSGVIREMFCVICT